MILGLLYVLNPFSGKGQKKWIKRSLQDYTKRPPYKLNLDAHAEWQVGNGQPHWWELVNRWLTDLRKFWKFVTLKFAGLARGAVF